MDNSPAKEFSAIPKKLQQIYQPPKRLYYRGVEFEDLKPSVAIVGTRRPTRYGQQTTHKLAYELASLGVNIISGLALGVDTIAHRACLEAKGRTVAVLPCNIETIYPRSHTVVADKILSSGGTLLSEYSGSSTTVYKSRFIERNRLVAGLADILLITEAAERSGTTSTANFALDQGKTVMVVPGNIDSVMSKGTNRLIKEGALPVTELRDILEVLGIAHESKLSGYEPVGPDETKIVELLRNGYNNREEIVHHSGLEPAVVSIILTKLEIAKVI